jgi:hypothetical protein
MDIYRTGKYEEFTDTKTTVSKAVKIAGKLMDLSAGDAS